MTTTLTAITDRYASNEATGYKRMRFSASLTNPYTASGDLLDFSSYFPNEFHGGHVTMVNPSVTIALAGIVSTGCFRGTTASASSAALQFFANGLSGTAQAGLRVDNTTANISAATIYIEVVGK